MPNSALLNNNDPNDSGKSKAPGNQEPYFFIAYFKFLIPTLVIIIEIIDQFPLLTYYQFFSCTLV